MIRVLKQIWLVVLLIAVQPAFCQYFNTLTDIDSSVDWGYNVFVNPDGTYFIIGSDQPSSTNMWDIFCMNVSKDGSQVLSKKVFSVPNASSAEGGPGKIKKLQDGSYLVPWTLSIPSSTKPIMAGGFMKMNATGDTIFTRLYTDTSIFNIKEAIQECVQMKDGGYLLGGERRLNGDKATVLLIRTDAQGNKLWEKIYRTAPLSWETLQSIEELDNSNILIGASSIVFKKNGQLDYYCERPWFIVTNANGDKIRDTLYTHGYSGGGNIYTDKNGGYFHWGALDSFITSNSLNFQNLPDYIAHLNEDFRIEWIKTYANQQAHTYIWNVKQLEDKSYVLVGSFWDTATAMQGWASQIIHPGFTKWEQTHRVDSLMDATFIDVVPLNKGSFVLTGNHRDHQHTPIWRHFDMWLVGVDSNGCVMPGCAPTEVEDVVYNTEEIQIYPNPSDGKISIKSKHKGTLYLSDMSGRVLQRYEVLEGKTSLQLPATLTPGVYVTRFVYEGNSAGKVDKLVYRP